MKAMMPLVRRTAAIIALTAVPAFSSGVQAQNDVLPPAPTVKLTQEQEHVIKEVILKEMKVPDQPAQMPTRVGEAVPDGVPVQPIPVEVSSKVPQVRTHGYVVKQDQVIVVDPKNKRIAAVVR